MNSALPQISQPVASLARCRRISGSGADGFDDAVGYRHGARLSFLIGCFLRWCAAARNVGHCREAPLRLPPRQDSPTATASPTAEPAIATQRTSPPLQRRLARGPGEGRPRRRPDARPLCLWRRRPHLARGVDPRVGEGRARRPCWRRRQRRPQRRRPRGPGRAGRGGRRRRAEPRDRPPDRGQAPAAGGRSPGPRDATLDTTVKTRFVASRPAAAAPRRRGRPRAILRAWPRPS